MKWTVDKSKPVPYTVVDGKVTPVEDIPMGSYLYIYHNGDEQKERVRSGLTRDPRQRVTFYSGGTWYRTMIFLFYSVPDSRLERAEGECHYLLKEYHEIGEVFKCSPITAQEAVIRIQCHYRYNDTCMVDDEDMFSCSRCKRNTIEYWVAGIAVCRNCYDKTRAERMKHTLHQCHTCKKQRYCKYKGNTQCYTCRLYEKENNGKKSKCYHCGHKRVCTYEKGKCCGSCYRKRVHENIPEALCSYCNTVKKCGYKKKTQCGSCYTAELREKKRNNKQVVIAAS
jgi:hypothetical protein